MMKMPKMEIKDILVTDICKKKNCLRDHTGDGRHKIPIKITLQAR
jgi:hypothetical protein